jgi:KipI family sensor histidine kinase inhibitor
VSRRLLPLGDSAVLVELDSLDEVIALARAIDAERPAGVLDVVPAARTIALLLDSAVLDPAAAGAWVQGLGAPPVPADSGRVVEVEVDYDGADLAEVAALLGVSEATVIEWHSGSLWRAAFGGFAPGFAYLVTDHERLRVPRRTTPRTEVPAGAVGLAGEFSAVYPRRSPGGWQLIGTSPAPLWDSTRARPALIEAGDLVRFVRRM